MSGQYRRDWQKTRIHAVCGAVIGGGSFLIGGGDWVMVIVGATVFGVLAGMYLDRFWEHFLSWWP